MSCRVFAESSLRRCESFELYKLDLSFSLGPGPQPWFWLRTKDYGNDHGLGPRLELGLLSPNFLRLQNVGSMPWGRLGAA